jgi:hypothetical protein
MSKHKVDKYSRINQRVHNKAGNAPQAPKVGSTSQNQYKRSRTVGRYTN